MPRVDILLSALLRIAENPATGPRKAAVAWKALKAYEDKA